MDTVRIRMDTHSVRKFLVSKDQNGHSHNKEAYCQVTDGDNDTQDGQSKDQNGHCQDKEGHIHDLDGHSNDQDGHSKNQNG